MTKVGTFMHSDPLSGLHTARTKDFSVFRALSFPVPICTDVTSVSIRACTL